MSGGSYDYLYSQDIEKLVSSSMSKLYLLDAYALLSQLGVDDVAEDVFKQVERYRKFYKSNS